jgi:protein-disulfide isomerase
LPEYWKYDIPAQHESLPHGVTYHGHPWVGAENPVLTIEEYTDYQCFQCHKNHFQIRKLINSFPDQIRLIHRHYPIDHEFNPHVAPQPYHIGSGRLALLAIAALQQNKFWEVNDKIYSMMQKKILEIDINRLADELDLDLDKLINDINSPITLKLLENDIKAGLRHEISGTPTYVIDNIVYEGFIPSEIIKKISAKDK